MLSSLSLAALIFALGVGQQHAQQGNSHPTFDAFEVATIKPVEHDPKGGRYIKMQGNNRFVEKDYTLQLLIAAAYDLNPKTISGGPDWVTGDHYDILALTPGETLPTHDEQMAMLRTLLAERFQLTFHREQKTFAVYSLEVAGKGGKLKPTTAAATDPVTMGPGVVHPDRIVLPARNANMGAFTSILQRAILDRPVVDHTHLGGRYDFDLEWAPDETQFGGEVPSASETAPAAPLFTAVQQQLGLKLVAERSPIATLVIDRVEKPSVN